MTDRSEYVWRDGITGAVLLRNSDEDPEMAYRRGFQQGAYAAYADLEARGIHSHRLRYWLKKVTKWRFNESKDREIQPPELSKTSALNLVL